jgi:hypothetical protein
VSGVALGFGSIALLSVTELEVLAAVVKLGAATLLASTALSAGIVSGVSGTVALVAIALLLYVDIFPEVDFGDVSGGWSYSGIKGDHRRTSRRDSVWTTAGIHVGSGRA